MGREAKPPCLRAPAATPKVVGVTVANHTHVLTAEHRRVISFLGALAALQVIGSSPADSSCRLQDYALEQVQWGTADPLALQARRGARFRGYWSVVQREPTPSDDTSDAFRPSRR